ncbi:unnamed protein product [Penicillium salamii]|uniref:Ankyrin repeat protein n=1 Tax=Penicillium salamii TaxID=1612424 RepID=A0A9W4JXG3_9EURO|nr:unnamed protein product [Penicillium salamii]CAG8195142.1 unnamed protein product [Penicillium salamii]CAG8210877.1 unnamed protein product [Penicillium salamii]CAG8213553.1 unnamed protein product [Penicillium salamii]CAG8258063.1 unnamed protein product [Penicillium salamii]
MLYIDMNVNLRSPNQIQLIALLKTIKHKYTSVIKIFLKSKILLDVANIQSRRPLTLTTNDYSNIVIIKLLLENGIRADSIMFNKHSLLFEAIQSS